MKLPDLSIVLIGPSGDRERWQIQWRPMQKGDCGETSYERRVVTINSRMRNPQTIRATILHEIVHVTTGQNGSEELAVNLEENFEKTIKALGIS
jgi:Zn-dependent peptidase ImmA (M78 family)